MRNPHHAPLWTVALRGHLAGPTSMPEPTPGALRPTGLPTTLLTALAPFALALWYLVVLGR